YRLIFDWNSQQYPLPNPCPFHVSNKLKHQLAANNLVSVQLLEVQSLFHLYCFSPMLRHQDRRDLGQLQSPCQQVAVENYYMSFHLYVSAVELIRYQLLVLINMIILSYSISCTYILSI